MLDHLNVGPGEEVNVSLTSKGIEIAKNEKSTVDVDFIISGTDFSRAAKVIGSAYAQFTHHDRVYHVTCDSQKPDLKDPERIDLVKDGFPLFREVVQKYYVTLRDGKHIIVRSTPLQSDKQFCLGARHLSPFSKRTITKQPVVGSTNQMTAQAK